MARSFVTPGLSLGPVLLALSALFACGARSGLDCFGERCALGQGGSGGAGLQAGDELGNAGGVSAIGGTGNGVPPQSEPPSPPLGIPDDVPTSAESPCAFDGVFNGSLRIQSRTDLGLLEGCSEVRGDLLILGVGSSDLRELGQLRRVTGTLQINNLSGSLAGLAALESVGNLWLQSVGAESLAPLGNLSEIGTGSETDGSLILDNLTRARDLLGLGNLRVVASIDILDSDSLETLSGLALPPELRRFSLTGLPALADMAPLPSLAAVGELTFIGLPALMELRLGDLRVVGALHVESIGAVSLSGLEGLQRVDTATLQGNANLREIDALRGLSSLDVLSVYANPVLRRLPEIRVDELRSVYVEQNAELEVGPGFPLATRIESILVVNNPELASFSGFSALRLANDIVVSDNRVLSELSLGQLQSAVRVVVTCNPALPEASLEPLRDVVTDLETSGNLGSASACETIL